MQRSNNDLTQHLIHRCHVNPRKKKMMTNFYVVEFINIYYVRLVRFIYIYFFFFAMRPIKPYGAVYAPVIQIVKGEKNKRKDEMKTFHCVTTENRDYKKEREKKKKIAEYER